MIKLTQQRLKEVLEYNSDTGIFIRISNGEQAGSVNRRGYRRIGIDGKYYKAHRLAWLYHYGKFPAKHLDHKNHEPDDNSIDNLREVTPKQNAMNQRMGKNNTSGCTGVYWEKGRKQWRVKISTIHIGRFDDKDDAIAARKKAEKENFYHPNHGMPL